MVYLSSVTSDYDSIKIVTSKYTGLDITINYNNDKIVNFYVGKDTHWKHRVDKSLENSNNKVSNELPTSMWGVPVIEAEELFFEFDDVLIQTSFKNGFTERSSSLDKTL